jgi:glycosyltransferase A (GT-A) superfamily protein (DUF2064 family)
MGERGLAILARWPEPGRVLPRLNARLGPEAAAQVYEAFLGDLVAAMPADAFESRLYCLDREEAFRAAFPGVATRRQRGGSEGRRLHACFEEMLAEFPLAVAVTGGLPDLHPRLVLSAFEMLERRDAVVGPDGRGGACLIGLREPRDVFKGVPWGTAGELDALLRNLEKAHLDVGFFPSRPAVETFDDLLALRRRLSRPRAPLTYAALRTLGVGDDARDAG